MSKWVSIIHERSLRAWLVQQIFAGSINLVWTARSKGTAALSRHKSIILVQAYNSMQREYEQYRQKRGKHITASGGFTSVLTLTSLRCTHMPQMSQHQQGPTSPKRGKALYKDLQVPPLPQSLSRHGTCPCMCCCQLEYHTLDDVLILQSAVW